MTYANPVLLAVDGARRPMPSYAAVGFAVMAVALGTFGGPKLWMATEGLKLGPMADRLALYACVVGPLVLVGAAALLWEARARVAGATPAPVAAPAGLVLGAGAFLAALGLVMVAGATRPGGAAVLLPLGIGGLLASLAMTLFQCWGEEFFFRGWLQPVLCSRWGPWVGLLGASLAFGVAHVVGRALSPLALLNDTLAGMMFGLLALRTGGLWAPAAAHFAWNAVEMSGVGATPNPGLDPFGALYDLDLSGPAWLGGGPDEMNGAITVTLVLALVIAGLTLAGRAADVRMRLPARADEDG